MPNSEDSTRAMLEAIYERFNARDIDAILPLLTSDVEWPNGWEGGYVHGREEVRAYWTRQWTAIDGSVTPQRFCIQPDGRIDVTVHQIVKNLDGDLLEDTSVHHIYRLRDDQIEHMEIQK
jgi:ketosteroid isomerase-like protein